MHLASLCQPSRSMPGYGHVAASSLFYVQNVARTSGVPHYPSVIMFTRAVNIVTNSRQKDRTCGRTERSVNRRRRRPSCTSDRGAA